MAETSFDAVAGSLNSNILFPTNYNDLNTDETLVGLWIDGRTLYRKIYTGNFSTTGEFEIDSRRNLDLIAALGALSSSTGYSVEAANRLVASGDGGLTLNANALGGSGKYYVVIFYCKKS